MNLVIKDIEASGEVDYTELAQELNYDTLADKLGTDEFAKKLCNQFDASSLLVDRNGEYSSKVRRFYEQLSESLDYNRLARELSEQHGFMLTVARHAAQYIAVEARTQAETSRKLGNHAESLKETLK